jgi:hypothetical protein
VYHLNTENNSKTILPCWLHSLITIVLYVSLQALGLPPTDSNDDIYSLAEEPPGACSLGSISELPGAGEAENGQLMEEHPEAGAEAGSEGREQGTVTATGTVFSPSSSGESLGPPRLPDDEAAFKDVTMLIGLDAAAY